MAKYASLPQKKIISEENALLRLESLCVAGEHCRYELSEKLYKWGLSTDASQRILESLEDRKFFNDRRFASAFVRDKLLYNKWGRMKIMMAMRAKRLSSEIISEALEEIDEEVYENVAREMLIAKAASIKEGNTYEGRTRLYRTGITHGFESSIVAKIVKAPSTWQEED